MHSVLVSALWPQRNDSLVFKATALMPLAWRAIGAIRGDGHA